MRLSILPMLLCASALAGCGTMRSDRTVSGAGFGAAIGVLGGPVGLGVGALAGGLVGFTTDREDINLGDPVWREDQR